MDELEQLRAENQRLREILNEKTDQTISLKELHADAARYRHLKEHHLFLWHDEATDEPAACSFDFEAPDHNIDAAIDAAMAVQS